MAREALAKIRSQAPQGTGWIADPGYEARVLGDELLAWPLDAYDRALNAARDVRLEAKRPDPFDHGLNVRLGRVATHHNEHF